jgi:hypothetical protein
VPNQRGENGRPLPSFMPIPSMGGRPANHPHTHVYPDANRTGARPAREKLASCRSLSSRSSEPEGVKMKRECFAAGDRVLVQHRARSRFLHRCYPQSTPSAVRDSSCTITYPVTILIG